MKTRTKRQICAALGWTSWLGTLAVVDGMDTGAVGLGAGAAWSFGLLILGACLLWKAGWIHV